MATLTVSSKPAVTTMRVAQISKPGSAFEIIEREIPERDEVLYNKDPNQ